MPPRKKKLPKMGTCPSEALTEFPKGLREHQMMPWEETPQEPRWPSDGVALRSMESDELLKKRKFAERHEWTWMVEQIDTILTERQGE